MILPMLLGAVYSYHEGHPRWMYVMPEDQEVQPVRRPVWLPRSFQHLLV